jgi:hypothetical protein
MDTAGNRPQAGGDSLRDGPALPDYVIAPAHPAPGEPSHFWPPGPMGAVLPNSRKWRTRLSAEAGPRGRRVPAGGAGPPGPGPSALAADRPRCAPVVP